MVISVIHGVQTVNGRVHTGPENREKLGGFERLFEALE